SINLNNGGIIAIAAPTSSPRLPALPLGLTKSFCTSTTISAAFFGSQRSFKLVRTSTTYLQMIGRLESMGHWKLVVVLALQTAMAHGHDVGARDLFAGEQARQQGIERSEGVVQHAAGKTHHRSFAQIGHDKHGAGQYRKT